MKANSSAPLHRPRWMPAFGFFFGLLNVLPFLAPVFMHFGWTAGGKAIYSVYSFLCHQLPERSFFLFGPHAMVSLAHIQSAGLPTDDPAVLRQFIGNAGLGWKVAWSDRMVSMYASVWLFGLLWPPLRRRVKALPWWGLALFLLPMALDGTTHLLSDLSGIGQGFRYANPWLAALTGRLFPAWFYAGDALGSFNSYMRLLTGVLFGIGVVWFGMPRVDEALGETEPRG